MDVTAITSLITSVGFPIVMCLLMYKYMTEENKATRETLNALEMAIHTLEKGVEDLIAISRMRYDIEDESEGKRR